MVDFLATTAVFFGALAYFIDSLSLKIRLTSGIFGSVAIFNHMSMVAMLFNRLAVSLTLPILGFLIDSGWNYESITKVITLAILLYLFSNLALLVFGQSITKSIVYFLRFYKYDAKNDISLFDKEKIYKSNSPIVFTNFNIPSFFCYFIIILGFFLPSVLASIFFDYRATIIQLGFSLNVFGTLINVLIIEKNVSQTIEERNINKVLKLNNEIIIGRLYGAFLAGSIIYSIIIFM